MPDVQRAAPRPPRSAIRLLACVALVVAACAAVRVPSAAPSSASPAPATPTASAARSGKPPSTEPTFIDAWTVVVEAHNARATELLISNPVSEYDLVGARLIELIAQTRAELSTLAPPPRVREEVLQLADAIAATLVMLRE